MSDSLLKKGVRQTPLPTLALAILMGVRIAEPLAYTSIFPYINQMVSELHIARSAEDIGFYSGVVESSFALVQSCTVYHWARLSDRIGRKPVIMMGLAGTAISGSMFGFSQNFAQMLCTRSLSGFLNGNVAVVRSAIGDITDETNSTDAFALDGLVWTVGSILGNSIGGYLSHPVERMPYIFPPGGLLEHYPFLLPCIVTTCVTICGLLFTWGFLKESHQTVLWARNRLARGRPEAAAYALVSTENADTFALGDLDDDEDDEDAEADARTLVGDPDSPKFSHDRDSFSNAVKGDRQEFPKSGLSIPAEVSEEDREVKVYTFRDIMGYRAIRRQLASLWLLSFIGSAWGAVTLLFFYTPTRAGGLGLTTAAMGTALAAQGFVSIVCQVFLLKRISGRFGIAGGYKLLNSLYILVFLLLPVLRGVVLMVEGPNAGEDPTVSRSFFTWAAVMGYLTFSTFVGMSNSLSMVLVNVCCPHKDCLGTLNGISSALGCGARVIGPSLSSALFAISQEKQVLGGSMWWMFLVAVSTFSAFVGLLVDDRPAEKNSSGAGDVESMGMEVLTTSNPDKPYKDGSDVPFGTLDATGTMGGVTPLSNVIINEEGRLSTIVEENERIEVLRRIDEVKNQ